MFSVFRETLKWAQQLPLEAWGEPTTPSTNDFAKTEALKIPAVFKLYLADHQSAGRGRGKNTWTDTGSGAQLLSSWSYQAEHAPQHLTALYIGLALYEAATLAWPELQWGLKPPNDLYINEKKVGGILIETLMEGKRIRVIVGIGINVFDHPAAVTEATDLSKVLPAERLSVGEWQHFLNTLQQKLLEALRNCENHTLSAAHREKICQAMQRIPQKKYKITDLTADGHLKTDKGLIHWQDL